MLAPVVETGGIIGADYADPQSMIGETLGHYSIIEKIGAGGMGEVYRARDLHLERDVAIKVLPLAIVPDDAARQRFRREALALSKLNHPNIATVFDFDTQNGVDFLAMEFIDGIPLSDRVATGALPESEVLRIGAQLAEGLATAHAEGVVHRDLKPGNLMIASDGRLKILDFGLAILLLGEEIDVTRSRSDQSGGEGTLPYMAPERVRGLPGDVRSDVYGAGAVLYELATAKRPFPQTHGNELVGAILHETSTPPRRHNPQLSEGLDRLVAKALSKEPSARYQTARELLVAIDEARAVPAAPQPVDRPVAIGVTAVLLVVLLVAIIGGGRDWNNSAGTDTTTDAAADSVPRMRRAVAVIGFRNLSEKGDEAWVSTALSEMLTTELAAGGQLRTIAGENVARMKIDLALAEAGSYGLDTLKRIRDNLGADDVVLGSYLVLGDGRLRLNFTLQHAVTGETTNAGAEQGSLAELDGLIRRTGAALRAILGARQASSADLRSASAAVPSSLDAMRPFAEGLARLRLFDHLGARDHFEKAVAADADNPLVHIALAKTWGALGYDEKARIEAKRAFELSTALSRENQLDVEGQYQEIIAEHEKAIAIYQTLVNFVPDNLDYGLRLASAQIAAGQGSVALATVDRLRHLPPPMSADPMIDLIEARAAGLLSDYARQRAAAGNAAAKGVVLGARMLVAQAQMAAGAAIERLGSGDEAIQTYQKALAAFNDAGDQAGVASAQSAIGFALMDRGQFAKADGMINEALVTLRRIGNKGGVASNLFSLGLSCYRRDDLPAARKYFEESLDLRRETNSRGGMAVAYNGLGLVLLDQGNAAGAKSTFEQSLAIWRERGNKAGIATALHNIGMADLDQSALAAGRARAEEALAIRREIGDKSGIGTTNRLLGNTLHRQGDLAGASKLLQEALALQIELGQANQAAYTREYLSQVLNDDGRAAEAESVIREAIKTHQVAGAFAEEAYCLRVLAESQLTQSKLTEAQNSIDAANRLLAKFPNLGRRLAVQITEARIRAAAGAVAGASRSLNRAIAQAATAGLVELELEARLSLGEVELREGQATAGRARLAELEAAAKTRGLGLYTIKAQAAARSR